jgi:hypothetical protein
LLKKSHFLILLDNLYHRFRDIIKNFLEDLSCQIDFVRDGSSSHIGPKTAPNDHYRSGFKTSDQIQGQGAPRIENGAYTLVREYFKPRDNLATGP